MNCRYCGQYDSVSLGDGIWSCNICGKIAVEQDCGSCGGECHMDCEEMRGRPATGPLAKALDTIDRLKAEKVVLADELEHYILHMDLRRARAAIARAKGQ